MTSTETQTRLVAPGQVSRLFTILRMDTDSEMPIFGDYYFAPKVSTMFNKVVLLYRHEEQIAYQTLGNLNPDGTIDWVNDDFILDHVLHNQVSEAIDQFIEAHMRYDNPVIPQAIIPYVSRQDPKPLIPQVSGLGVLMSMFLMFMLGVAIHHFFTF